MGLYRYVSKEETKRMKEVKSDNELNELFQEALQYNDRLLIEESYYKKRKKGYKGWFLGKKDNHFEYRLYFEERAYDGSPYQAQYITAAITHRDSVITYLYGIINGGMGYKRMQQEMLKNGK